jgi:hypothetical protein
MPKSRSEQRREQRKNFSYYMRLIDEETQDVIGHLTDISTGGFKMDSTEKLPLNKDYRLRMDLIGEVASKSSMIFVARTKWCETDPLDPFVFNIGFQIIQISPNDMDIFKRIVQKYGSQSSDKPLDKRQSNLW